MEFIVDDSKLGRIRSQFTVEPRTGRCSLTVHLTGHRIRGTQIEGRALLEELQKDDERISHRFGEKWQSLRSMGSGYLEIRKEGGMYGELHSSSFYANVRKIIMCVVDYVDQHIEDLKREEKFASMRSRYYYAGKELEEYQAKIAALTQERTDLLKKLYPLNQPLIHPGIVTAINSLSTSSDSSGFSNTDEQRIELSIRHLKQYLKLSSPSLSLDTYEDILKILAKYKPQLQHKEITLPTIEELQEFVIKSAIATE